MSAPPEPIRPAAEAAPVDTWSFNGVEHRIERRVERIQMLRHAGSSIHEDRVAPLRRDEIRVVAASRHRTGIGGGETDRIEAHTRAKYVSDG